MAEPDAKMLEHAAEKVLEHRLTQLVRIGYFIAAAVLAGTIWATTLTVQVGAIQADLVQRPSPDWISSMIRHNAADIDRLQARVDGVENRLHSMTNQKQSLAGTGGSITSSPP